MQRERNTTKRGERNEEGGDERGGDYPVADPAELPVSLSEAVAFFPARAGRFPTVATIKRRIKVGCRGVRLYGFMSGACWFTTRAAVERFHEELTRREVGQLGNGTSGGSRGADGGPARRASSKAAKDYLKRLGIGSGKNKNKAEGEAESKGDGREEAAPRGGGKRRPR